MVRIDKIDSVQLDESVYNRPKINLINKQGFNIYTLTPKPERAWETFVEILKQIEEERKKNETI